MKLIYFKGKHRNFGDDLNPWMWPQFLPDFFDDDARVLFLGIGSIISDKYARDAKKIVFGTGYVPQYDAKPDVSGDDWDIFFVRGPNTVTELGIAKEKSVGDSAILLRSLLKDRKSTNQVISFMPHWESFDQGHWQDVCDLAGINLIDPRESVEDVLEEIFRSKLILAEAMHGAIVADTLRVPWIALLPLNKANRMKWYDWAGALNIDLKHERLLPSSFHRICASLKNRTGLKKITKIFEKTLFYTLVDKITIRLCAWHLKKLANRVPPSLSDEKILDQSVAQMLEQVKKLKEKYG